MSGNASNIKAGGAFVEIGGDDTKLKAALDRAAKRFKIFASMANQIGREMLKIGTAIVAPIALAARTYETMGNSLFRASQRAGIGASQLSALGYAAQQSGVEMEDLENGIKKMQKTLGAAAGGSKEANQALEQIGVTMEDLKGLAPDEQFVTLAEALSKVQDPTMQAAEAMKIFGKNGTQLLPMINQGVDGINAYIRRARALGIVIGDEAARGAAEFHDRLEDLSDVLKNGLFRAGEAVAPVLMEIVNSATAGVVAVNRWISAHKAVVVTALEVGAGVAATGVAFLAPGQGINLVAGALRGFGTVAGLARAALSVFPPLLTAMLNPITLVVAGLAGIGAYLAYNTDVGRTMLKALGGYFSDLASVATDAFGGVRDALAAGDWKLAADVAWAGLKVAWMEGIAPLKTLWLGLKIFSEETWNNIKSTVLDITYRTTAALKNVWAEFEHWYTNLVNKLGNAWANHDENLRHEGAVITLKNDLRNGNISQADFDKMIAQEDRHHANQLGAVDELAAKEKAANDATLAASLAKNDAERDAALAGVKAKKDAEQKRIDDQAAAEATANQKDLDDKKAKLAALVKQAHKEGGGKSLLSGLFGDIPGAPGQPRIKLPSGDDFGAMMTQVKAAGTFSARGAPGLAGTGAIPQKQLDTLQTIVKLTEKAVDASRSTVKVIRELLTLG